ncbi:uncharacterized protein LOC126979465 isoform X2 [Leptidea sinapis]|uniref:uncharacterized protein LOC126979465 isoform X2 n=1 Tax=Leptidea sinapis TaxID=189913 RepID=UPI002142AF76|nr:uncharacterized protein LOC126979465 isoform X2 [Leptidea sinapis]
MWYVEESSLKTVVWRKATHSDDEGEQNRILEGIILEVLERIRELMKEGSDLIPVLDPIKFGPIQIDEGLIDIPGLLIRLDEIVVSNLSTFRVLNMNLVLESLLAQRYRMEFDMDIPSLNMDTNSYALNIPIFGGSVFGEGDMKFRVVEPRTKGVMLVSLGLRNGSLAATIDNCDITFNVADIDVEITGMLENEATSQFVSDYMKKMLETYLSFFENEINAIISIAVKTIGNIVLGNIDLGDFLISSQ